MFQFSHLPAIRLDPPVPIFTLTMMALDSPKSGYSDEVGSKDQICSAIVELLQEKSEMLKEYFSIEITPLGALAALPGLLADYLPDLGQLPEFLLNLATRTNFEEEQECLSGIARELAIFYAVKAATIGGGRWNSQSSQEQILFSSNKKQDNLHRALEYCAQNPETYLFSHTLRASENPLYIVQDPFAFVDSYLTENVDYHTEKIYYDVMRTDLPVKFVMKISGFCSGLSSSGSLDYWIKQRVDILKRYIQTQWETDTQNPLDEQSWLEFGASQLSARFFYRQLHNPSMVFYNLNHLCTFMTRLEAQLEHLPEHEKELLQVPPEFRPLDAPVLASFAPQNSNSGAYPNLLASENSQPGPRTPWLFDMDIYKPFAHVMLPYSQFRVPELDHPSADSPSFSSFNSRLNANELSNTQNTNNHLNNNHNDHNNKNQNNNNHNNNNNNGNRANRRDVNYSGSLVALLPLVAAKPIKDESFVNANPLLFGNAASGDDKETKLEVDPLRPTPKELIITSLSFTPSGPPFSYHATDLCKFRIPKHAAALHQTAKRLSLKECERESPLFLSKLLQIFGAYQVFPHNSWKENGWFSCVLLK